ncbi:MAG: hypothetical protein NZL83_02260 [Candidatus Absconditabacterales bacterium]|nr:hypothetical protein [Candidatus Absconditabacterales bacterium]
MMVSLKVFFWTSIFWIFLLIMGRGFLRFFDTNLDILVNIFPHIQSAQPRIDITSDTITLSGVITSHIDTLRNDLMNELAVIKEAIHTSQQPSQPLPVQPQETQITPSPIATGASTSMTGNQSPTTGQITE